MISWKTQNRTTCVNWSNCLITTLWNPSICGQTKATKRHIRPLIHSNLNPIHKQSILKCFYWSSVFNRISSTCISDNDKYIHYVRANLIIFSTIFHQFSIIPRNYKISEPLRGILFKNLIYLGTGMKSAENRKWLMWLPNTRRKCRRLFHGVKK